MIDGELIHDLIEKYYKSLDKADRRILRLYSLTLKDIEQEILNTSSQTEGTTISDWHKKERLTKLEKQIKVKIYELMEKVATEVEKTAIETAKGFDKEFVAMMNKNYPEFANFSNLHSNVVEELANENWLGITFKERMRHKAYNLTYECRSILRGGLMQGKSIAKMIEEIRTKTNKPYRECTTMVRTETLHVLNASVVRQFKDMEVERVQHYTAKDERVCEQCGRAHGKEYPLAKAPKLPLHVKCRCTYIPVDDVMSKYQ